MFAGKDGPSGGGYNNPNKSRLDRVSKTMFIPLVKLSDVVWTSIEGYEKIAYAWNRVKRFF